MQYFFYGTLLDPEVRRRVLGVAVAPAGEAARLPDYRRVGEPGKSYPTLVAAAGSAAEGLLVGAVTPRQRKRLLAFEGDEYREIERMVTTQSGVEVAARLFVPRRPPLITTDWSFARWQRVERDRFVRALATEWYPPPARRLRG